MIGKDKNRGSYIPAHRDIQDFKSIIRFDGKRNYTFVYTNTNHEPLKVAQTLKWFEERFPMFLRIDKPSIVNPEYIEKIVIRTDKTTAHLLLTDGTKLKISRRKIDFLLSQCTKTVKIEWSNSKGHIIS